MNLKIDDIYRQKQERRRHLSRLSISEKVEIIEQLRDLAGAMKRARHVYKNPGRVVFFKNEELTSRKLVSVKPLITKRSSTASFATVGPSVKQNEFMTAKQQLLALASHRGWSVIELLNYLQEHGRISDNIVTLDDLPASEAMRVLPWLRDTTPTPPKKDE